VIFGYPVSFPEDTCERLVADAATARRLVRERCPQLLELLEHRRRRFAPLLAQNSNTPVQQESLDVMCASASGGVAVSPDGGVVMPPPSPGPSATQARALAAPVLSRLGWGDASLDVAISAPTTNVIARKNLDGHAVAGWTTTLDFDKDGKLTDANGWIGAPTRGRAYPLISASNAYKRLLAVPRAMPEICQMRKDGKPGCEPIPPTVITAATLGLALRHDLDRPLLVPAWLFTVQGSSEPLVAVAVDPRYLKPPASGTAPK